jgi:hypothetical protein
MAIQESKHKKEYCRVILGIAFYIPNLASDDGRCRWPAGRAGRILSAQSYFPCNGASTISTAALGLATSTISSSNFFVAPSPNWGMLSSAKSEINLKEDIPQ